MRIRLGTKFIILVVPVLSLTLAFNAYDSLRADHELLEEQLLESSRALGQLAAYLGAEAIIAYDFVTLENYVHDVNQRRDVLFGVFLDKEGRPLTSYLDRENPGIAALDVKSEPVSVQDVLRAFASRDDGSVRVTRFPIVHHDQTIGSLALGISLQRLDQQFESALQRQLLVSSLIILVLSVAIFLVFRHSVLRPIRALGTAAVRVKNGDYDRPVEVLSNDELGALAESFNAMMGEVRKDRLLLNQQANYDSLTGLPNRLMGMDRLRAEINRASRDETRFGMLFIDLDNFKIVNDTMGHPFGDALLVEISRRLSSELRASDTLARLGGDEFLVLLPRADTAAEVERVGRRLVGAIEKPVTLESREVFIHCSIGAAIHPSDGATMQTLMANADNAMYQAKRSKEESICFFAPEMNEAAKARLVLEHDLHLALEKGEMRLEFQPIVDARDGARVGAEALLRWHHPDKGLIRPAAFIPLAEATRRIVPIGGWVLREACCAFSRWIADGLEPGFLAVNVSRVQLHSRLESTVEDVLKECAIPPALLHLEVTESVLIEHQGGDVSEVLASLEQLGVRLVLDDFGTGFSSLSDLKHFPFHILKIDKSFIDGLPHDAGDAALVQGIIAMARGLGLKVVGEGVERAGQWQSMKAAGAHMLQGYLFGQPMDEQAFMAFLRASRGTRKARTADRDRGYGS
jgi:diguanylate cyclase (GGDEF)-like protein